MAGAGVPAEGPSPRLQSMPGLVLEGRYGGVGHHMENGQLRAGPDHLLERAQEHRLPGRYLVHSG
jgi:hypothetical protein